MASERTEVDNLLAKIDGLISAINIFQDDKNNTSIYLSDMFRVNVINFIIDFFTHTKGKEWLPKQITNFIVKQLPVLEFTLKGILVGYLESMLSCSVKPMITEKMILDGVYFDLQSIDLNNMLKHQPVIGDSLLEYDNYDAGKYLYFGCHPKDGINIIPDLVKCRDFNAFLWYVKNCPGNRFVWKSDKYVNTDPVIKTIGSSQVSKVKQAITYNGKTVDITRICRKKTDKNGDTVYYTLTNELVTPGKNGFGEVYTENIAAYAKQGKSNGVVTLEYTPSSTSMTDAEHNAMTVREPIQNCLHIFIGCCDEIVPQEKKDAMNGVDHGRKLLDYYTKLCININTAITDLENSIKVLKNEINQENNEIINGHNKTISELRRVLREFDTSKEKIAKIIENGGILKIKKNYFIVPGLENSDSGNIYVPSEIRDISKASIEDNITQNTRNLTDSKYGTYPTAKSNYYYMHPLLEFNTDLVYSMKWFDEKVFTAQLINALTSCFEFHDGNLNANGLLSVNLGGIGQIIHAKLNNLIECAIEDDNFNIDKYDEAAKEYLNKIINSSQTVDASKFGLTAIFKSNEKVSPVIPGNTRQLFSEINNYLSNSATTMTGGIIGMEDAIENCITKVVTFGGGNSNNSVFDNLVKVNGAFGVEFNTNLNMFELLIKKMMYIIISTFLMPKIYMIIKFNMTLLGDNDKTFDVEMFITYCKSMLGDIINAIKNEIVEYFKEIILEILNELISYIMPLKLQEQYRYYKQLLTSCADCVRLNGLPQYDWMEDAVNYADIEAEVNSLGDNLLI